MADDIKKALAKLTPKEKQTVKLLLLRVKLDDTVGLDIKRLSGHGALFRVRKGRIRIIYRKNKQEFIVLRIDRRNEGTYRNL